MRKKKNSITVSLNGIDFAVRFSYPNSIKNSPTPCRALVTPISPKTGRLLTKRQLSGKESDCIVDRPVYGKSPEDILKNHIEPVLRNLLFEMQTAGLIDDVQTQNDVQDLATLAAEFEDTFFELHKNEWKSSTISSYRGQYKILMDEIKGCTAEDLTNEVYTELQYKNLSPRFGNNSRHHSMVSRNGSSRVRKEASKSALRIDSRFTKSKWLRNSCYPESI